ncbi:MAG: VCBS repeat-containing protein, partial [Bryobacteraceae bacterium]
MKTALLFLALAAQAADVSQPWVHHRTFADFSAGTFPDGGTNLYIPKSGGMQSIHRWDFNNDGQLDLLDANDHNPVENEDALVYWGTPSGPRSILPPMPDHGPLGWFLREVRARESAATRLPSDGGGRSLIADLNNDGYPDIVFCNFIHNYSVNTKALIYWGGPDGYRAGRRTELPTLLAGGVAVADFNHDGFLDLVFSNQGIEGGERFGFDMHKESYIYWNGPTGFSTERRTSIPTISAADVAAADLNGDGYPELLFINNNSQEKSFYLYWGSSQGFSTDRRTVWKHGDPIGLRLTDLNGDKSPDLIVTHRDNRAEVFRWTGKEFETNPWVALPTLGAAEARVSDLNKDGHPDLIFANRGTDTQQISYIYWGSATGFDVHRRTELPTMHATDAAVADFNGDGWPDLAFSNERNDTTLDVNSYIYWNGPQGFHAANRGDLQGFGAVGAQAADLNGDGHPDLVLINRSSETVEPVQSVIYWGNSQHVYSLASTTSIPGPSEATPVVADFNQDGWVDIVFPNGWIYWGGREGYSIQRRQEIKGLKGHGLGVADLNRDGYLDLVLCANKNKPGDSSTGSILWGSAAGFSMDHRLALALSARTSVAPTIADFNKDGYLDILFPDVDSDNADIFWGGPGFDYTPERRTQLKVQSAATVEVADLNHDGWLDLLFGGGWERSRFGRPTRQSTILWGGAKGYSTDRALKLESYDSLEQSVADLNKDGYLDIVMTNYHAYDTRSVPAFIYWGGPGGAYSESRRESLPAESSSALTVADLNQDGWLDLVVFNHLDHGNHNINSNIYWGGPQGYSVSRRQQFPTFGSHFGVRRDIGNIYDRRMEEDYLSAPLQIPSGKTPSQISWKARTPNGTGVRFQLRS